MRDQSKIVVVGVAFVSIVAGFVGAGAVSCKPMPGYVADAGPAVPWYGPTRDAGGVGPLDWQFGDLPDAGAQR